ncbi:MAG: hypothetical protein QMD78_06260 [Methanocellales archaeon]|nr:hypothetical protein [Methanocellales archaeon]
MISVLDASSVVRLAKTDCFHLLKIFEKNYMPKEVYEETVEIPREIGVEDALITLKAIENGLIEITDRDVDYKRVMELFGFKEVADSKAISLCLGEEGVLITDDEKMMKACIWLNLKFQRMINLIFLNVVNEKISVKEANTILDLLKEKRLNSIQEIEYTRMLIRRWKNERNVS